MSDTFPKTLEKAASEQRLINMDFSARLLDDETVDQVNSHSAVAVDAAEGLALEDAVALTVAVGIPSPPPGADPADFKKVQFLVSGGCAGYVYRVRANIDGSLGTNAQGDGYLYVY